MHPRYLFLCMDIKDIKSSSNYNFLKSLQLLNDPLKASSKVS